MILISCGRLVGRFAVSASLSVQLLCSLVWSEETPDMLQQQCDAGSPGSPQACYRLALLYRAGRGLPKDATRGADLLVFACTAAHHLFYPQACFTACVARISEAETCVLTMVGNAETMENLRIFLAESDSERRRQMVSTTRDVQFLHTLIGEPGSSYPEELSLLPDYKAIQEAAQARVVEIAQTDPDPQRRYGAVIHTFDKIPRDVLQEIARKDPDRRVREGAGERLAWSLGPPGINPEAGKQAIELATKSADAGTRAAAAASVTDQAVLAEILRKDPAPWVRERALVNVTDEGLIVRIAEGDKDHGVRYSAAAMIKDEKVLERLVRTSRDASMRLMIAGKLQDPATIVWVAENDGDAEVRDAAIARIADQTVLARIARREPAMTVRLTLVRRLTDPRVLAEIAKGDKEPDVRHEAAQRLQQLQGQAAP